MSTRPDKPARQLPSFTPVPRLKDRSNGWKPQVQRAFIEALADTGSVSAACKRVNRSTHGAYQLRREPGAEEFAAAWQVALDLGIQRIEDIAMERAINGTQEPVYSYGKLVGTRTRYNDRLLMFMLRNRAPERFADGKKTGSHDAISAMQLEREKKRWRIEWRAEWEAEQTHTSPQDLHESIDRKIESVRREVAEKRKAEWEALSDETRAAWKRFAQLKARDLSEQRLLGSTGSMPQASQGRPAAAPYGAKPSDARSEAEPPQAGHPSRPAPEGEDNQPAENKASNPAADSYHQKHRPYWEMPEAESESFDGIRRLKDEGWD